MCFIFEKIYISALISEKRLFGGCFEMILCSNINACTFFRKLSALPFSVTLSLTMIL